jgi:hypothetical protein
MTLIIGFETANRLLRYDAITGKLFWRERTPDLFREGKNSRDQSCKTWNSRFAGKEALTARSSGYGYGAVLNRLYLAHRVCWLLHYGVWPKDQIDHINGDRSDNRIVNLRSVDNAENSKNHCARVDNSTGVVGVYWFKRYAKWVAAITANGKFHHLGYHDRFDDAVAARKAAESELGFHPNHGRAA